MSIRLLLILALPVLAVHAPAQSVQSTPRSTAEFVLQGTPADEPVKAYSGSAAERRARLADRAKSAYALKFDLQDLPAYQPSRRITGTIRLWGNNYVGDSGLAGRWRDAFKKLHPEVEFELVLPTAAVAVPALYFGLARVKPSKLQARMVPSGKLIAAFVTGRTTSADKPWKWKE